MPTNPTLGVQMFTLRQYTQATADLDFALGRIREIGYTSIQVSAFGDIKPAETARLCAQHGITIDGTHTPWDRLRHDLDRVIEEHKLWQCRHTAVGMIPPKQYLSLSGLDQFRAELEPIATRLAEHDITFSYHNHNHEFAWFEGKPWLAHLYDTVSPELLGAELDTHWIVAGGADPVPWIRRCGNRMPLLHLKDFVINAELRRNFAPIGHGNMNWTDILHEIAQHPIEHCFIEQDDCYGRDEFECLRQSFDFLKSVGFVK